MIGLEYPWFMLGLALLAVPVLAHLMHRHIPRRLVFPSIRFLRRAELPPEGRRRLRDLLLLLLRLLALAAAVLAFARPTVRPLASSTAADATGNGVCVFLVDASASMGTRGVAMRTAELLRTELAALAPGERAGLVLSADRVLATLPPGTSPDTLLDRVTATAPLPVAGNHDAALREATTLLAGDGPRRLVVISDLQLSDWQECRTTLPPGVQLRLLNPSEPPLPNVAITAATVAAAMDRCRVTLEIRNLADTQQERQVTVRVGQDRQTVGVSLPPLQVRRVALVLRAEAAVHGIAELSADDFSADDTLHFWAAVPPAVTVLAVVPGGDDAQGPDVQAFFLTKGLESSGRAASAFRVRTVSVEAFPTADLSAVPVLFVLGAADRFDQAAFAQLKDFCLGGGTAVCTPGAFAGQMIHGLRANGIFDSRLNDIAGQVRQRGETWNLGWLNPDGILGQGFADAESTDLFMFPIRQYLRLELPAHLTVHLKTTDGEPVLAEQSLGRGRVFVLALALDTQWSDLPLSASFVALVQEIARAAVPAGYGIVRLDCGQALPEFRDLLGRPLLAAGAPPVSTAEPGVFALGERPVEVNVSRRESSPERINPFDLARRLQAPTELAAGSLPAAGSGRAEPLPLWPAAALLVALLVLAEMGCTVWTDYREIRGRAPAKA